MGKTALYQMAENGIFFLLLSYFSPPTPHFMEKTFILITVGAGLFRSHNLAFVGKLS